MGSSLAGISIIDGSAPLTDALPMTSCRREPSAAKGGGPDALTAAGAAFRNHPTLSDYPDGLDPLSTHILVEPVNGARPGLLGCDLVVAFRRRVIEEPMNRIRINVAFVPDVVFLQLSFLRPIRLRQVLIEGAVVDEDGRLDFRHVFRLWRATVERGSRRQIPAQPHCQGFGHDA